MFGARGSRDPEVPGFHDPVSRIPLFFAPPGVPPACQAAKKRRDFAW
ncbi:hypothetical protein BBSC_0190 [Bifidobacterium scardovii JCM 12489 = DSM 13734]|nr:hypothetical protein BBSC_0190 [Bifidobacterium scardovii JCM 12489 = DSM 13734]